jgi:flagellar hook-basal body complex protein FliE
MRIESVINQPGLAPESSSGPKAAGDKSFGEMLNQALGQVNDMQQQADTLATQVSTGEIENVHQAVISMEKSVLALELTVQVRNRVVEAYQELMKTQI